MTKFIYGDCGQPIGVIEGSADDLSAECDRRRAIQFERDLQEAMETGKQLLRSSSMLGGYVTDAIWAVAREYPNPTIETIEAARAQYRLYLESLIDDDPATRCEKSGHLIDDGTGDTRYHVCPYHCES